MEIMKVKIKDRSRRSIKVKNTQEEGRAGQTGRKSSTFWPTVSFTIKLCYWRTIQLAIGSSTSMPNSMQKFLHVKPWKTDSSDYETYEVCVIMQLLTDI